jgi:5-methyltetrahydropteroyltriglutamate--homocysteine methyltransferase
MSVTGLPIPRAEVVGSLLQPSQLLQARQAFDDGSLSAEELRETEDAAVLAAINLQESAGLDILTDGEMRRRAWSDTVRHFENIVPRKVRRAYPRNPGADGGADPRTHPFGSEGPAASAAAAPARGEGFPTVSGRIALMQNSSLGAEFRFLVSHARIRAKYTMAAPSYHRRYWSDDLRAESGYGSCEEYLEDVRDALRGVAERLVADGCTYIQLDAPNYGTLCDQRNVEWHRQRGHDTQRELAFDAALDSSTLSGLPVTSALHICRGNLPGGAWHSSGGYAAIAEAMFPNLGVDVVLLEYDSDRAGDFRPIHLLKSGTVVVLGLLTTKYGALESNHDIEARIRDASTYRPIEEMALSTQCGFASAANAPMSFDEQRAKLEQVTSVARRVWR